MRSMADCSRGYSALVEQHAAGFVPDVIALQRRTPASRVARSAADLAARRGNRIVIRHPLGRVVCMIEIVSPGNKSSQAALRQFVEKTAQFIEAGVNVLVIDLFPPSIRDPHGIHKAIWDQFEDQPFPPEPDKPLTLAAYVAGAPKTAYIEPVAVGDVLPDMPAWLDEDSYVPVPLEETYHNTWLSCPEDMREAVLHA